MEIKDKVVVVTGAASGIGAALCRRARDEGARAVVASDIDEAGAMAVAGEVGGVGRAVDVTVEREVAELARETVASFGQIDLYCSNAGVFFPHGETVTSTPNAAWQQSWDVHVMAHVYAARALLPDMIRRGDGYILITASAAGLLSQIESASYSVTKHAAVGFAESLVIAHGDDGVKVSVLCPQAVRTGMTGDTDGGVAAVDGMLEPEEMCDSVVEGLREERFLILPHREVVKYMQRKTGDYERWIRGMRRFRARQFGLT